VPATDASHVPKITITASYVCYIPVLPVVTTWQCITVHFARHFVCFHLSYTYHCTAFERSTETDDGRSVMRFTPSSVSFITTLPMSIPPSRERSFTNNEFLFMLCFVWRFHFIELLLPDTGITRPAPDLDRNNDAEKKSRMDKITLTWEHASTLLRWRTRPNTMSKQ